MNAYDNPQAAQTVLENAKAAGLDPDRIIDQLKRLHIETPSWAYAEGGTRFGVFRQAGSAKTIEHKLADAAAVHCYTGITPTIAVHVLWDFPDGFDPALIEKAKKLGIQIGAVNPNVFQDQAYKYGSLANPKPEVRKKAIDHVRDSIKIATQTRSKFLSIWLADGTNYPGQDDIAQRRARLIDSLKEIYQAMPNDQVLLLEYKPFEPAFYQTDIADWGMSMTLCRKLGDRAKVLVDIGHHYQAQNIEQIVTWLIEEDMLGGFHFNDRRYADDDLTTASIDPYQVFRIFNEIVAAQQVRSRKFELAYMVDQSHNLKPKLEAMLQTVDTIHQLYAKALLVNRKALAKAQADQDIIAAEEILRDAWLTDTRPLVGLVRQQTGRAPDAIAAYRKSGYQQQVEKERANIKGGDTLG